MKKIMQRTESLPYIFLFLLYIIVLLFLFKSDSQNFSRGEWYFAPDAGIIPAHATDIQKCTKIKPNEPWQNIPVYKNYKKKGWYLTTISYSLINALNTPGIHIPLQTSPVNVYINGKYIISSRSTDFNTTTIMGKPLIMPLDKKLFNKKENIIAISISCTNGFGGIYGSIAIDSYHAIKTAYNRSMILKLILISISIFIFFFFLLIYFNRKDEKYYLYFSLLALSLSLWMLGYNGLVFWLIDSQLFYNIITYLVPIYTPLLTILFIDSFFGFNNKKINIAYMVFSSILGLFVFFELVLKGSVEIFLKTGYVIFTMSILPAIVYGYFLIFNAIKKRLEYSSRFLFGLILFGVSVLYSLLGFTHIINIEPIIVEGFHFMVIIFATILATRFAQVHSILEKSYRDLIETTRIKDSILSTLELYQHIVSTTDDLLVYIDLNENIKAKNASFSKYFNLKEYNEDGTEENIFLLFYKGKVKNKLQTALHSAHKGSAEPFEGWYNFPQIGYRFIDGTVYPYADKNTIKGFVLSIKDGTDRLNIEKKVISITQQEQQKIGSEIHDNICQDIRGISLNLEFFLAMMKKNKDINENDILDAINNTNSVLQKARTLSHGLYPIDISSSDFNTAIKNLISNFAENYPSFEFKSNIDNAFTISHDMKATQLFYIISEALKNSVTHSSGTLIFIQLICETNIRKVIIIDNGKGITDNDLKNGIGLQILRYRSRMINADIEITNMNPGLRVECTL